MKMIMKLLKYEFKTIFPFGDGEYKTIYDLTILKSKFFGLYKTEVNIEYEISMFGNISDYEIYWDELIMNGINITTI
jgi:hypothetical protein